MLKWMKAVTIEKLFDDGTNKQVWLVRDISGKERKAVAYSTIVGDLKPSDEVWLNTTATSLMLGTGGVDFIIAKLNETEIHTELPDGHIMKLRYTPYQLCVQSVEEESSFGHEAMKDADSVNGMVTLVGELHSMLPILTGVIHDQSLQSRKECNVVYIMTDGAALPIAFSDNVRKLKELGWITKTITAGHSFGGDGEAVNIYSALLAAKHVYKADITIVLMGPGTVGTGTKFGTTSIEFGSIINAVHSLDGTAVGVPRISFADPRERHKGISHHTVTSLAKVALARAIIPIPELNEAENERLKEQITFHKLDQKHHVHYRNQMNINKLKQILDTFPGRITTMGRGIDQEEAFFLTAAESAMLSWELWQQSLNELLDC